MKNKEQKQKLFRNLEVYKKRMSKDMIEEETVWQVIPQSYL